MLKQRYIVLELLFTTVDPSRARPRGMLRGKSHPVGAVSGKQAACWVFLSLCLVHAQRKQHKLQRTVDTHWTRVVRLFGSPCI